MKENPFWSFFPPQQSLPTKHEFDPTKHGSEQWLSTLYLPRDTLGQLYQYLAAPLDDKIPLKVNKSNNWWHP